MRKTYFFTTLTLLLFFCSYFVSGQNTFEKDQSKLWVKSFAKSEDKKGSLNYYLPIRFSRDFPMLNKKYPSSKYTYVFYVIKTQEPNKKIFSLYNSGELHSFFTDSIKSAQHIPIDLSVFGKGSMVNFNFYNKDFAKSKEGIFYLENNDEVKNIEFYEAIVCSSCSLPQSRLEIQTYLALKYGITLVQKGNYYSSDSRKVWDEAADSKFNNNIIGLAKDTYFGLNQTASYSNVDSTLVVKAKNAASWTDYTYAVLGTDQGEKVFDSSTGKYKRKWLMQNKGDSKVIFDLDLSITPEEGLEYLLFQGNGQTFYHDENDSLKLSFKDIEIQSNENTYFSLMVKKPFNLNFKEEEKGFNKKYTLTFNEVGKGPFSITAQGEDSSNTHSFVSNSSTFDLSSLPKSTYSFTVTDAVGQIATLDGKFIDEQKQLISLEDNYFLEPGKNMEIKPTLDAALSTQKLFYSWYFNDKVLSKQPNLIVNQSGAFQLKVTSADGRSESFPFTVTSLQASESKVSESGWIVSPNPVDRGQEFTVTYFFDYANEVDFYIYTLEGKFILRDRLGSVKNAKYNYTLEGATTYVLVAVINGKTSMQHLIVK